MPVIEGTAFVRSTIIDSHSTRSQKDVVTLGSNGGGSSLYYSARFTEDMSGAVISVRMTPPVERQVHLFGLPNADEREILGADITPIFPDSPPFVKKFESGLRIAFRFISDQEQRL